MTMWKSKNEEEKEYKASFGSTDYNIPTIGYKGAFFICILSILILIFIPDMVNQLFNGFKLPGCIVSSLLIGFVISYSQHFIQSSKGFVKSFYVVGGLFSLFTFMVLFIAIYGKILL